MSISETRASISTLLRDKLGSPRFLSDRTTKVQESNTLRSS